MSVSALQIAVWGIKGNYQIFFHSSGLAVGDAAVRKGLEDVRSTVKYQSIELSFYSVKWIEGHEVYTTYTALYDWNSRKNGYVAVSLFVPIGKRVVGGPVALLDRLMGMYCDQYVGTDWKIKQVKEDSAPFLQAVESAWIVEETRPVRRNSDSKKGFVRFKPGTAGKHLENPYRGEFSGFDKVFFLPEGQDRLSVAPALQQIKLLGYGTEMARPVTYPVSIKPKLGGSKAVGSSEAMVQINGVTVKPDQNGVYTREFLDENEQVSVMVACEGYLPLVESRTVKNWNGTKGNIFKLAQVQPSLPLAKRPEKADETQRAGLENGLSAGAKDRSDYKVITENSQEAKAPKVWSSTGGRIDGPFTLEIYLKDARSKEAVMVSGQPVQLKVTNLGGTFYSSTSVLTLRGLKLNDQIEGIIDVEGYRGATLNYSVRPEAGTASSLLMPKTVFLEPRKIASALPGKRAEMTGVREENSMNNSKALAQWVKIGIAVVIGVLICAVGYLVYDGLTDGVFIKEEDRVALKQSFYERAEMYRDSSLHDLLNEHLATRNTLKETIIIEERRKLESKSVRDGGDELVVAERLINESEEILSRALQLAYTFIDTSKTHLPKEENLILLAKLPIEEFADRMRGNISKMQRLNQIIKEEIEGIANKEAVELKRRAKAKQVTEVANSDKLYPVDFYGRYIELCKKGNSATSFSTTKERSAVLDKLEILREASRLWYNAVNNVDGQKIRWISQLQDIIEDSSLTLEQRKMLRMKMMAIPL